MHQAGVEPSGDDLCFGMLASCNVRFFLNRISLGDLAMLVCDSMILCSFFTTNSKVNFASLLL